MTDSVVGGRQAVKADGDTIGAMSDGSTPTNKVGSKDSNLSSPRRKVISRARNIFIVWSGRSAIIVVILGSWQGLVELHVLNVAFTSSPSEVGSYLGANLGTVAFWQNAGTTLEETIVGFVVGASLGVGCGLLFARYPRVLAMWKPYITALNSMPRVALTPLFILWFGLGPLSKIVQVISLVIFILLVATLGAIANVDPDLVRLARVLGFSERVIFRKVLLRWAMPGIFAGLDLALVYSFLGAVVGEMLGAKSGLGNLVELYSNVFNTAGVIGVLVVIAVIASILALLMQRVLRLLMRYQQV